MLPEGAPSSWNRPFLNLVVEGEADGSAAGWLEHAKAIEQELGPRDSQHWSPRSIDIDLLLWGDESQASENLVIPHPELTRRAFVLTPLAHLAPGLSIPGCERTVLELSREVAPRTPLWMGVINVTPDSFSDGGRHLEWPDIETTVDEMVAAGAHLIDVGAESTRPGASAVSAREEWSRLEPVLGRLFAKWRGDLLRPLVSVDTRHASVAERALELGADWINDVGGLTTPEMQALARGSGATWVAMHHLTLPVELDRRLPDECDPVAEVSKWLEDRMTEWLAAGLDLDRIVFDPGIGFGKNALQSLRILRELESFAGYGLRLLIGHSRKSFMKHFAGDSAAAGRDLETLGASLALAAKPVEILRVHNVPAHARALAGWSHLQG